MLYDSLFNAALWTKLAEACLRKARGYETTNRNMFASVPLDLQFDPGKVRHQPGVSLSAYNRKKASFVNK